MDLVKMLAATFSLSVMLGLFSAVGPSFAQEAPAVAPIEPAPEAKKVDPGAAPTQFTQGLMEQIGGAKVAMDTMWTLIAGMLVFFMNLGFASVESGLCRAKNTVTILAKNFVVFAAASIAFLVLGRGFASGWFLPVLRRRLFPGRLPSGSSSALFIYSVSLWSV